MVTCSGWTIFGVIVGQPSVCKQRDQHAGSLAVAEYSRSRSSTVLKVREGIQTFVGKVILSIRAADIPAFADRDGPDRQGLLINASLIGTVMFVTLTRRYDIWTRGRLAASRGPPPDAVTCI